MMIRKLVKVNVGGRAPAVPLLVLLQRRQFAHMCSPVLSSCSASTRVDLYPNGSLGVQ